MKPVDYSVKKVWIFIEWLFWEYKKAFNPKAYIVEFPGWTNHLKQ